MKNEQNEGRMTIKEFLEMLIEHMDGIEKITLDTHFATVESWREPCIITTGLQEYTLRWAFFDEEYAKKFRDWLHENNH